MRASRILDYKKNEECIFAILWKFGEFFDVLPFFVDRIRPSVRVTDFGFHNRPAGTPPKPPPHTGAKLSTNVLG